MRRTDRLFDILQILRDGRLHRAGDMAARLGVSTRTLWRDMGTLMESGLPIEGERGLGYVLRAPITLPPLMLNAAEMEALRKGVRLVAEGEDPVLARAARMLAGKIGAVAPAPQEGPEPDALFAYSGAQAQRSAPLLPEIRAAIRAGERLAITYLDPQGAESHRDIRPLALELWGKVWSLAAWCEARQGFRAFRIDRILSVTATGERFAAEPGRSLADYRAQHDRPETIALPEEEDEEEDLDF